MLRRKASDAILAWKTQKSRQALLITGARQTGKTTLVRSFAQDHYDVVAEINFFERPDAVRVIREASSADDLLLRITALTDVQLVPGRSLVFFDEIQEFEDILTWAKFLVEHTEYDYVFSGSLLGIDAFDIRSWPVGFLEVMQLYPLDFEEFCWASGVADAVLEEARAAFLERRPVVDFVHEKLMDLHAKYLLIGGMPDAVQNFVVRSDLAAVRRIQRDVVELYRHDIAKYMTAKDDARFVKSLYDAIPSQLNKENKRFKFKDALSRPSARFAHLETSFEWLEQAGVALPVFRVSETCYPLSMNDTRASFKLFMNDIGLLTSQLMGTVDVDVLLGKEAINYGSLYENFAAQELKAQGFSLHYYHSTKRGEVDFVVEDAVDGTVSLIEIKSGKDYKRHNALRNLLNVPEYEFKDAFVFCNGNVEHGEMVTYLPIYLLGFCGAR